MKISVIIPIYNEETTLLEILNKVNSQNSHDFNLEIIVIDDCSTDNSQKIIETNIDLVSIYVKLEKNGGKGAAVREGLKKATGDYILFQDGDLEYNPEDYNKIFKVIKNFDADIIIGSRFLSPEYTRVHYFFHKVGNKTITLLFNFLYNTTFTDIYSCYLCFKRSLIGPEELKTNGWEQQAEILAKAVKNSSVHYEVPISYSGRSFEDGKKIKARHSLKVIYAILRYRLF